MTPIQKQRPSYPTDAQRAMKVLGEYVLAARDSYPSRGADDRVTQPVAPWAPRKAANS